MAPSTELLAEIGSVNSKIDRANAELTALEVRLAFLKTELAGHSADARAKRFKWLNMAASVLVTLLVVGLYFKS